MFCYDQKKLILIPINCLKILIFLIVDAAAAAAKSLQLYRILCDPIDGSPRGSPVPGILQTRNTRVGCHFLLQCMKVKSESEVAQSCLTLRDPMDYRPPGPPSIGFSTGVGCSLL